MAIVLTLAGLAGLVFGGRLFVDSAVAIAREVGVSDKFIAITLLAGGTSLPELAACVVAAARKKGQLALGNILGSNIFNILLILGISATVSPISFSGLDIVDVVIVMLSMVLVWMSSYTFKKDKIDRYEGAIFLLTFIAYYVWLFIKL
jgi:cation:H+ antiporter